MILILWRLIFEVMYSTPYQKVDSVAKPGAGLFLKILLLAFDEDSFDYCKISRILLSFAVKSKIQCSTISSPTTY